MAQPDNRSRRVIELTLHYDTSVESAERILCAATTMKREWRRFIATEFFGRKALFACQPHNATVTAETAVLVYEFDRRAVGRLIGETPELIGTFAAAFARLAWYDTYRHGIDEEPPPEVIDRLTNLYRGQIEANYDVRSEAAPLAAE